MKRTIDTYIEEYGDYLYRIAFIYTKDKQLAEEVVQDVFLRFHEGVQLDVHASEKTYLTRMTINRSYDYLRKWKVRSAQFFDYFKKHALDSERQVIEEEERDEILQAILQLPLKYREVILLYYYDELPTAEMAELLQIPQSTVLTRLQRARQRLKEQLPKKDWEVLRYE